MSKASHVVAKAQCPECAKDPRVEEVSSAWYGAGPKVAYSPFWDYKGFVLPEEPAMPSVPLAHATPDLTTAAAGAAALRTFFRIGEAWALTNDQQRQLLGCARSTFFEWKQGRLKRGLDAGTLERLSHVFGIWSALQLLLPIPERANAWIRRPNTAPLFGGGTALERMLAGQVSDLFVVRQYLDAQRGGRT
jgi:hypothetical protein